MTGLFAQRFAITKRGKFCNKLYRYNANLAFKSRYFAEKCTENDKK